MVKIIIGIGFDGSYWSPENVKFKLDGVGGPSAGLMFTLAIYDQVSGQDLKATKPKIAGTGQGLSVIEWGLPQDWNQR